MKFIMDGGGVKGLGIAKVSAGWVVVRYELTIDSTDVLAGAFDTPAKAAHAAECILAAELGAIVKMLEGGEAL